uniref:Zgc:153704 n=1 Tax=Amphilophus citrinellus TaxID=61819 RepID=A0A3Q0QWC0_AMPCI
MASLLTLLGAVLCSLMVSSEVVPQADFDLQALAGKWYLIGIATNDLWFLSFKNFVLMGTATITPTADGDLELVYSELSPYDTCYTSYIYANKTEVPGIFTYVTEFWGYAELCMAYAKYDEYYLTHTTNNRGNESFAVNRLYGRDVELSAEVHEKFRQFSLETGILSENIVILPKNGTFISCTNKILTRAVQLI